MSVAWKVLTAPQLAILVAEGSFAGAPVDLADGYIHMSTADQLPETLAKHFAGQGDLHLAAIDLGALGDALRWEESRGDQLFPHLYARLPLTAVIAHGPFTYAADGALILPDLEPFRKCDSPPQRGGVGVGEWCAAPRPRWRWTPLPNLPRTGEELKCLMALT